MTDRHDTRTVQWGHWAITFMAPQPDRTKNFGVIVGSVPFPVANGCGPQDGLAGSSTRTGYQEMCQRWIEHGEVPAGFVPTAHGADCRP